MVYTTYLSIYNCFTNIKPYAIAQGTVSGTVSDAVTASGGTSPGSMSAMSRMASSVAMGRTTVGKHQKWKELVEVLTRAEVQQQCKKNGWSRNAGNFKIAMLLFEDV